MGEGRRQITYLSISSFVSLRGTISGFHGKGCRIWGPCSIWGAYLRERVMVFCVKKKVFNYKEAGRADCGRENALCLPISFHFYFLGTNETIVKINKQKPQLKWSPESRRENFHICHSKHSKKGLTMYLWYKVTLFTISARGSSKEFSLPTNSSANGRLQ